MFTLLAALNGTLSVSADDSRPAEPELFTALSPDGRDAAFHAGNGDVVVRDRKSLAVRRRIPASGDSRDSVPRVFLLDGGWTVLLHESGRIEAYDGNRLAYSVPAAAGPAVRRLADIVEVGKETELATLQPQGGKGEWELCYRNTRTGERVVTFALQIDKPTVLRAVISGGRRRVCIGDQAGGLWRCDAPDGRLIRFSAVPALMGRPRSEPGDYISHLDVSPSGESAIVRSGRGESWLLEVATGAIVGEHVGEGRLFGDGRRFVNDEGVFDAEDGRLLFGERQFRRLGVNQVVGVSRNGEVIVTKSRGGAVFWEMADLTRGPRVPAALLPEPASKVRGRSLAEWRQRLLDGEGLAQDIHDAADALYEGGPSTAPDFLAAITRRNRHVVLAGIDNLTRFGPEAVDVGPGLADLLDKNAVDPLFKDLAIVALAAVGAPEDRIDLYLRLLKEKDCRLAVCRLLRSLNRPPPPAAVPALVRMLADSNWLVRREALWTLEKMGAEARSALPEIEYLVSDKHPFVARAAQRARDAIREK